MPDKYFVNPYNFVRTEECNLNKKCSPTTHEKFDGFSGKMVCQLTTLTRTMIAQGQERGVQELQQVCDNRGFPIVPASSLKGMVRSISEVVANGCYVQVNTAN